MFAESLLESPWADRSRRGWSTIASFAAQALCLGILLILPLLYTEGLPKLQLVQAIAPPAPPPGPPPTIERHASIQHESNMRDGILVPPETIPTHIATFEETTPPEIGTCTFCVPGGTGNLNASNAVLNSVTSERAFVPPPRSVPPPLLRVSRMMEGNLIYRPQPIYPALAKSARVQGQVLLRAIISREGTIQNLQVISGHPMLVKAAIDAVRQWRYRPYLLNNEPVEVETQVTVNFVLSGG